MPFKSSRSVSQRQQLSVARENTSQSQSLTLEELQILLAASEKRAQIAEKEILSLQAELQGEKEHCRKLEEVLEKKTTRTTDLAHQLSLEKEHSRKLYHKLRVERRARQRGQAKKEVLEDQIRFLRLSDLSWSDKLKSIKSNASKAIDALLKVEKENSSLRSELSKTLERCNDEVKRAQLTAHLVGQRLKESRILAARLQKRQARAGTVREKAVQKAREKAIQERSVHTLLNKGIYTEETRNLIRLLVQAGCSREYVGDVIHAIFKTAGISVIGRVSRRTVSRIVVEGYFAAQMQLGYEMQNTESMFLIFFKK
jgi:hypothetical protein